MKWTKLFDSLSISLLKFLLSTFSLGWKEFCVICFVLLPVYLDFNFSKTDIKCNLIFGRFVTGNLFQPMLSYFICAINAKTSLLWNVETFTLRYFVSFSNYSIYQGKLYIFYYSHLALILPTANEKQQKREPPNMTFWVSVLQEYLTIILCWAHAHKKVSIHRMTLSSWTSDK